jgi:RNA polymerase sigma-70 factor (ECF subfamily)
MGADRHQSEELFQEVFLAVWTERARYEFPRPFRAWLLGIAVNKCRDAFRRAVPPAVAFDAAAPLAPAGGPGPADLVIAAETAVLVQRAVGQLPEQQRMVVVLRLWNGLSYSEIAEVTGRTESTVRSNMFHGLTAIRRYLEPRMR